MKARIGGLRVVAFTPRPERSDLERTAAEFVQYASPELVSAYMDAMTVTMEHRKEMELRAKPRRQQNNGKPVIAMTGDDREGA